MFPTAGNVPVTGNHYGAQGPGCLAQNAGGKMFSKKTFCGKKIRFMIIFWRMLSFLVSHLYIYSVHVSWGRKQGAMCSGTHLQDQKLGFVHCKLIWSLFFFFFSLVLENYTKRRTAIGIFGTAVESGRGS